MHTRSVFSDSNIVPGGISITVIYILAGLLTSPAAHAQTTCTSNPLETLVGTWTYSTEGADPASQPFAAAGKFVASIGTARGSNLPIGVLQITQSQSQHGVITSQETDIGTYQISPDCSGGTLIFKLSTRPFQFDFWFVSGGAEIRFVSTTQGFTVRGTATSNLGVVFTGSIQESQSLCTAFRRTTVPIVTNAQDLVTQTVQGFCGGTGTVFTTCPSPTGCVCSLGEDTCDDFLAMCQKRNIKTWRCNAAGECSCGTGGLPTIGPN